MSFVDVRDLCKSFGELKAVDRVSFTVNQGEVFGLLGPNGAGKSTLISMMTTLLNQDQGEILVDGISIKKEPMEVKKVLGLVPQEIALYPTLTARENLEFWGKMYGLRRNTLKQRVEEALEIAGLQDRAKGRVETFSGGMKRRINIAAALLHKPKLLIMDEPTVGIDPQSRNHILETVLRLNKEGMTVVYTSHYMEEVEYLCNRIAIMDHGKIIAMGTKDELGKLVGDRDAVSIDVHTLGSGVIEKLKGVRGIENVTVEDHTIRIITKEAEAILAKAISIIDAERCRIQSMHVEEPNLESVFLHLTGRALRD